MAIKYKNACQTNQPFVLVWSYMIFKFNLHTLVKFRLDHALFFCRLIIEGYPRLDKIRSGHKKITRHLWNIRRKTQIQTKLDQPSWNNRQHQTPETRPQLQTSRKKRSWTPQETMAMRRCRNRSNDLNHGGGWLLLIIELKNPFDSTYQKEYSASYSDITKPDRWEGLNSLYVV